MDLEQRETEGEGNIVVGHRSVGQPRADHNDADDQDDQADHRWDDEDEDCQRAWAGEPQPDRHRREGSATVEQRHRKQIEPIEEQAAQRGRDQRIVLREREQGDQRP